MQIREKQMEEMSQGNFDFNVFMEASFPTLKSISVTSGALGYSQIDEDGEQVIQIGRGDAIDIAKFPQTAEAMWSNTKTGAETIDLDWEDSVSSINTKIGGKYKISGKVMNLGIYNPLNLTIDYTISIDRGFLSLSNWYKNGAIIDGESYANATKAEDLSILGGFYVTAMAGAFNGMENIESIPKIDIKNDVTITSLANTYRDCKKLVAVPDIDTSNCTNFDHTFAGASALTDLSNVDMSKATTISGAFQGCTKLTKVPNDTSSCTDFTAAFADASSIVDLGDVDMSNATKITEIFRGCTNLENVPKNMGSSTDFTRVFSDATSLVDISDVDMSKATTAAYAFSGCTSLQHPPKNMSNCTNFSYAFQNDTALVDISDVNMSKANSISHAFSGCVNLISVPTFAKLGGCAEAFYGCTSLPEEFPYILDLSNTNSENCKDMFKESSVKTVRVRYTGKIYPEFLTAEHLGVENLTILDAAGNVRSPFTEIVDCVSSGTYTYTVPQGVSKLKVAMVSGASYSFVYQGGDYKITNNQAFIKDSGGNILASSLKTPSTPSSGGCMGVGSPSWQKHGGIPAMFDAVWEDGSHLPWYSCGCMGHGKGYNNQVMWGWASLGNTFNQEIIDVTPGQKLTVVVPSGSHGSYAEDPWADGKHNLGGFVLIQPQEQE